MKGGYTLGGRLLLGMTAGGLRSPAATGDSDLSSMIAMRHSKPATRGAESSCYRKREPVLTHSASRSDLCRKFAWKDSDNRY